MKTERENRWEDWRYTARWTRMEESLQCETWPDHLCCAISIKNVC